MVLTATADSTSQRRQEEQHSGRQREFGAILEEKSKQVQENRSMEGKSIGYTKTGQLYFAQVMQRTYN